MKRVALGLLLAPCVTAQWSVTATAPANGTASATVAPNGAAATTAGANLAVGPVAPGVLLTNAATAGASTASSRVEWHDTVVSAASYANLSLELYSEAHVTAIVPSGSTSVTASTAMDTRIVATLQAPTPEAGRLSIARQGCSSLFGQASIEVDLGNDGTIDYTTSPFPYSCTNVSGWSYNEFLVHLPAGTTDIGLRLQNDLSLTSSASASETVSMRVLLRFRPDEPAIDGFDVSGATNLLSTYHAPYNDTVHLTHWRQSLTSPSVMVIGFQPTVLPLTGYPATLLVTPDFVSVNWAIQAPLPAMPPGFAFYAQCFELLGGTIYSSNSVQAIWP
ncbi:MAG: hypothetical protein KAI24_07675 [Planctomycetes bacterium]|nr:hypothetical protein [Planctomycetota bacterium]